MVVNGRCPGRVAMEKLNDGREGRDRDPAGAAFGIPRQLWE